MFKNNNLILIINEYRSSKNSKLYTEQKLNKTTTEKLIF